MTTILSNSSLQTALAEAEADYTHANPNSLQAYQQAISVMPGGNTRSVLHYSPFPLTLTHAKGAHVMDADGHDFVDLLGEYTAGLFGHSDPVIRAAIDKALDDGLSLGGPNTNEGKFAEAICTRFPAIERVRFCNSGTEANVFALSAARAFTGRDTVIVIENGYHGGVLYFAGNSPLNLPIPFHKIPFNDSDTAKQTIHRLGDSLAAVILEPMLGGGGCFPASKEFLDTLRRETAAVGALLIFDEVMTSRLAPGGLHQVHGITPDLVTLGKYVGGGMSFGAFGGRADIMARFDPRDPKAWPHAGTFNNNTLTMAAGLTGLTKIYTPEAAAALNTSGDRLRHELARRMAALNAPVHLTGMGSMMCYHFTRHQPTRPEDLSPVSPELKALIHLDLLHKGYYVARRGMVILSLPLTQAELDGFADAFEEVIRTRLPVIEAVVA